MIPFIQIPAYNGKTGNWESGRRGTKVDTIVIHWMDGTLASTDITFQNPARIASAHFGVEDSAVHQYVKILDTAFHAGNWPMNLRSVGIEHSAAPGRDASDATYETSSQLIASIAKQLGMGVSDLAFRRHSEVSDSPTECCGTIDVSRLVSRALEIEASNAPTAVLASVSVPVSTDFWVQLTAGVHIRKEPNTASQIVVTYPLGSQIECDGQVDGESVNGNTVWFRSKLHGYYFTSAYAEHINQPNTA